MTEDHVYTSEDDNSIITNTKSNAVAADEKLVKILKEGKLILFIINLIFFIFFFYLNKIFLPFNGAYVNNFFSRHTYESLESRLGFKLINYTTYRANIFVDLHEKNRFEMMKYFLKTKKPFVKDIDGFQSFLLLKLFQMESQKFLKKLTMAVLILLKLNSQTCLK